MPCKSGYGVVKYNRKDKRSKFMKNINDRTLTIIDENGKVVACEILFTFHSDEFNKNYVLFFAKGADEKGENVEINAATYTDDGELFDVETDEEWEMLEEVLAEFEEDNLLADEEN